MSAPDLFHHPSYDAPSVGPGHRFPMRKYSFLARRLKAAGHRFIRPDPATADQVRLAHGESYAGAVLSLSLDAKAERRIGFPVTADVRDRSLAAVGGTVAAARRALQAGRAVNLAGGSHHAHHDFGAGFCVFNDVAVAARVLLAEGAVRRVAVVDCDVHQGDGTASIFAGDPAVWTGSLHCEANWPREKPPSDLDIGLPRGSGDAAYAEALGRMLDAALAVRADLVFYNAGVDIHSGDRLGLLDVSDQGLLARDRAVWAAFARAGQPLCAVLGGGYSTDADAVAARHAGLVDAAMQAAAPA